jgi:transposase
MAHKTKSIEANMTRFAELVGRGATQPEAARAVGVSPSLGEKWMRLGASRSP